MVKNSDFSSEMKKLLDKKAESAEIPTFDYSFLENLPGGENEEKTDTNCVK